MTVEDAAPPPRPSSPSSARTRGQASPRAPRPRIPPPSLGSASAADRLDGRRQRTEKSRQRIVAALIDLVRAGELAPTAEAVAARSGVGLRTVFRLFSDMDGLHQEMARLLSERVLPHTEAPFRAGDWRGRLEELAERRALIFEELLPFKRAGDAHAARSEAIRAQQAALARFQRDMLVSLLPADLKRRGDDVEALDLILSLDAWRRLRVEQGLSPAAAARVVARMLRAALADMDP